MHDLVLSVDVDGGRPPGLLALVGGAEFLPGNEAADRLLVEAANRVDRTRPAFILATAAARHDPDAAVGLARSWFGALGLEVEELRVRTSGQAKAATTAARARQGRFFYLAGGDPGLVATVLHGTPTWEAIVAAWRGGAALAGSSAGAMAMGAWTLVRARTPGDAIRDARRALNLVPGIAVVPHLGEFGQRWVPSVREPVVRLGGTLLGLDEATAAVYADSRWRVAGPGIVRVINAMGERDARHGEEIEGLPTPG